MKGVGGISEIVRIPISVSLVRLVVSTVLSDLPIGRLERVSVIEVFVCSISVDFMIDLAVMVDSSTDVNFLVDRSFLVFVISFRDLREPSVSVSRIAGVQVSFPSFIVVDLRLLG